MFCWCCVCDVWLCGVCVGDDDVFVVVFVKCVWDVGD